MENNDFLKAHIKIGTSYYFDDIIKLEGFDIDNILIDKKLRENIYFMTFRIKIWLEQNLCKSDLIK